MPLTRLSLIQDYNLAAADILVNDLTARLEGAGFTAPGVVGTYSKLITGLNSGFRKR